MGIVCLVVHNIYMCQVIIFCKRPPTLGQEVFSDGIKGPLKYMDYLCKYITWSLSELTLLTF